MARRSLCLWVLLCLGLTPVPSRAGYKVKPFSVSHAKVFAASDSHDNIAVAAEPYDETEKVLRVFDRDPARANYITVLIVVSNDSDMEIELNSRLIELSRMRGGALHTTSAEDVVRDIFFSTSLPRNPAPKVGLGIPLGGNSNKDFESARIDFLSKELGDKFVAPHSTAYGFIFFETRELGGALVGGKIYIPKVTVRRSRDSRQVGRDLMFYEIDLKPAIIGKP
jgi:hypothetical protein